MSLIRAMTDLRRSMGRIEPTREVGKGASATRLEQRRLVGAQSLIDQVQHDRRPCVVTHHRRKLHDAAGPKHLEGLRERFWIDLSFTEQLSPEADDQSFLRPQP